MERKQYIRSSKINSVRQTVSVVMAAFAIFASTSLTSCVKDELFDTPHPDKGAVVVAADWSNRSAACAVPAEYTLYHTCCGSADPQQMPGEGGKCHPTLFEPGSHTLVAHNAADKIAVSGLTATVAAARNGGIDPLPGYLLSAAHGIEVMQDDTTRVVLPMRQRVRDLHIELTVTEGDPDRIASVEGTLSGIAGAFDLAQQSITGEAANTSPAFTRAGDKVTADVRLLGTAGGRQTLTLEIRFTDGRTQTAESDLTELLAGFNLGDMTGALTVRGNLLTPIGAGFIATVTDWEIGEREDVEIH